MERLPDDVMLKFHPDTLQAVRKVYGLDKPGAMRDAVDILETWVKQQNHFVKKDFPRDYLERMIITTKGSVERAKQRLDKICTFRSLMPHLFINFEMRDDYIDEKNNTFPFVALPELSNNNDRIFLVKGYGDMTAEEFLNGFKVLFVYGEYLRAHDYVGGIKIVADFMDCSVPAFITALRPIDLHQGFTVMMQGYGMRLNGMYMLSHSKLIDGVVTLFRQVLSAKLGERITVHKTLESLHEVVPKDLLPKEYGGKQKSYLELRAEWLKVLSSKEFKEYQRDMNKACTDESLRPVDNFNEQYMGMPGTFRTLSVD